jgi:hypothetical protein
MLGERRTRGGEAYGVADDEDSVGNSPIHNGIAGPAKSVATAALPRASLSPARWTNIERPYLPMP